MKKLLMALSIICASVMTSKAQMAQGDFTFGVGLHLGLPLCNLNTATSFGLGGEVQGEYGFSEQLTGVATVGYTNFFGKSVDLGGGFTSIDGSASAVSVGANGAAEGSHRPQG